MNVLMRTFGVPRCTIPVRENASKGGREFPRPLVQASHMSSSLTGRVVVGAGCLGMILMEIEKDEKEENSALVVAEQKNITPPP